VTSAAMTAMARSDRAPCLRRSRCLRSQLAIVTRSSPLTDLRFTCLVADYLHPLSALDCSFACSAPWTFVRPAS